CRVLALPGAGPGQRAGHRGDRGGRHGGGDGHGVRGHHRHLPGPRHRHDRCRRAPAPVSTHLPVLAWLLVTVRLASGAGLAVAGRRAGRLAPAAGVGVAAVTAALGCAAAVTRPSAEEPLVRGIPAALRVDGLSAVMVVTVAVVTLAVLVFAAG